MGISALQEITVRGQHINACTIDRASKYIALHAERLPGDRHRRPTCDTTMLSLCNSAPTCTLHKRAFCVQDDGSGRQQFRFTPVAGGYQIDLPFGRTGCSSLLSASACSSNSLHFADAPQGPASTWSVLRHAADPAPATRYGGYQLHKTDTTHLH